MGLNFDAEVAEHDSGTGRVLAVDGEEGFADDEGGVEGDDAGDLELDDARAGGFDGSAETAGAGVVEVGDGDDFFRHRPPARPPGVNAPKPSAPGKARFLGSGVKGA